MQFKRLFLTRLLICLSVCLFKSAVAADYSEIEARIVAAYSRGQCNEASTLVQRQDISNLRPNILAVLASCNPSWIKSEELFALAEQQDSHNDLIEALHALWLEERDHELAKPHWQRVLMLARNEFLRETAREYLGGESRKDKSLNLSPLTAYLNIEMGGSYHSAPWILELPQLTSRPSVALDSEATLRLQRWTRFGSISMNYKYQRHQFFENRDHNNDTHLIGLPLAMRVGASQDLTFRPFMSHARIENRNFLTEYGIGFSGVVYTPSYKQSVEGSASSIRAHVPSLLSDTTAHYHFNYTWEWYPPRWFFAGKFSADNFSGSRTNRILSTAGDFNQSHNDVGLELTLRKGFNRFSLGFTPKVSHRIDSNPSIYTDTNGVRVNERRTDWNLSFEPHVIWRVFPSLQLKAYYQFARTSSSISKTDYLERSHTDHILGLVLRTFWSSY